MASKKPFGKMKEGALHKMLGVKKGGKIAPGTLIRASKSKSPLERRRAQFAINAKKFNHKKKGAPESGPGVMLKKSVKKGEVGFKKKSSKKVKVEMAMKKKGAKCMKKKSSTPFGGGTSAKDMGSAYMNAMKTGSLGKGFGGVSKKKASKKKPK